MDDFHKSVLLQEVLEFISPKKGERYIDATIGGGGHGIEILKKGGVLLGIDVDEEALEFVKRRWKLEAGKWNIEEKNLILVRGNFREIDTIARLHGFERVAGILFDLGVSSHQLDTAERGFSFQKEGPLDMRMDKNLAVRAVDLLHALTKGELYELFTKLGEEHRALAISENIIRARGLKRIETTRSLADIIRKVYKEKISKIDPATRVFQALRIAVNDELNSLKEALSRALDLLDKNGRILVISFHSLEDRIVKQTFLSFEEEGKGKVLTKKPIIAGEEELKDNPRTRSAKLRVFERISVLTEVEI